MSESCGKSSCTPLPAPADRGGHARDDRDRELQTLRAVDREDAHRVVVGLGQDGLDDPRALGALEVGPRRKSRSGSRRPASLGERARLVDDEADASPEVAGPAVRERRSRARAARARCDRAARSASSQSCASCQRREGAHRFTDRMSRPGATRAVEPGDSSARRARPGTCRGRRRRSRTAASAARSPTRARRSGRRRVAAPAAGRGSRRVAYTSELVSARYGMPACVERVLEVSERRARRQQDRDVAEPARFPGVDVRSGSASRPDQPSAMRGGRPPRRRRPPRARGASRRVGASSSCASTPSSTGRADRVRRARSGRARRTRAATRVRRRSARGTRG